MKFGLFGGATAKNDAHDIGTGGERLHFSQSDDSHGYGQLIDGVVEAERLGFHSIFLVEHHFTGSAQISASLNLLTFIAARTSKIRLGTAVVVVPWHNPVLLAEQAATVDVLSNGRLDFGVGKGYRPNEFERFCIPLNEASERFEESIALIKKALISDERFSHHSARWNFENIIVEPPPVQRPHPPLWLAAGRPESLRKAAIDGYSLLLDQFATFDLILERLRIYREAVEAAGRNFDPMSVAVARNLTIVRNDDEREAAMARRMKALAYEQPGDIHGRKLRLEHGLRSRPSASSGERDPYRYAGRDHRDDPAPARWRRRIHPVLERLRQSRPDAELRRRNHARLRLTRAALTVADVTADRFIE